MMATCALRPLLTQSRGRAISPVGSAGVLGSASVIIPCYKYGHYLPAAVASALAQPRLDIEVIIVDDHSPDGSAGVANDLAEQDQRVKVIHHARNLGHIATYNDGLEAASGDFVALVSADDILTPGSLTRSALLLRAHPDVGFAYGRARHFSRIPPQPRTGTLAWIIWSGTDWLAERFRAGHNVIASPEVLMRSSIARRIGGYRPELPHSGDLELWMRAATVADVGYVVGPDQALYRQHQANMHKERFRSEQAEGSLIDLEHRWAAFESVISTSRSILPNADRLDQLARATLANEALNTASQTYLRGRQSPLVNKLEDFARSLNEMPVESDAWRNLRRRQKARASSWPVNPRWAARAILDHVRAKARRHRIDWIGV